MVTGMLGNLPVFANIIPKDYIVTRGFGDTNIGSGNKFPWKTGSFDMALVMAKVEKFNLLKYSSVLPPEATEISIEAARNLYNTGAVMGTIMARADGYRGERICAGIGRIQVRRIDGIHIGGYVAEYIGNGDEQEAKKSLHTSLMGIVSRRYSPGEYVVFDEKFCIQEHQVKNKYGTAIVLIGFLSNVYPLLGCY
ncbi:MAG: pyruvoyl-dependent arginine decarboxylase [Desulfitobacteriaceae bacterium]|nr:pyruvoyl-dependent arginine decarboxylase [Desulfitobacteriaceae bacterium]